MVNYVALLGWNPGTEQEIFSMQELLKDFSFDKIHKASAVFDIKKLDWMNGEYIKKLPLKKFVELARPYLEKNVGSIIDDSKIDKIMELEQQRVSRLNETGERLGFLFADALDYDGQILVWKKSDASNAIRNLGLVAEKLSGHGDWSKDNLEKSLIDFIKGQGLSNGEVLWPLRVALTGQEKSPTPFEVAEILGKEKTLARIKEAIEKIKEKTKI
jgi:glutamyl/glutaminyl-tRNA synthetase